MAKRIMWGLIGGLGGWLLSLVPLIGINALAYMIVISPGLIPIIGASGLLLAIVLGGLMAGLLGGRGGGVWDSALAGLIAGALLFGSLRELINVLSARNELPYLIANHLLRTEIAIGFIACLILAVAVGAGAFFARRRERIAEEAARMRQQRRPSGPGQQSYPHTGMDGASRPPVRASQPAPDYRDPRERTPYGAERQSRERTPRW